MPIVTASQKATASEQAEARYMARMLSYPYVDRAKQSLPKLQVRYQTDEILIGKQDGPALYTGQLPMHTFHLSMAQLRILRYQRGQIDHLLAAVGDEPLTSFLDATLGLAADSLLVSYAHPECQRLVGLEGHPGLAYITNYGCRHFQHEDEAVTAALRRIQVVQVRYESFLSQAETDSYDIVYLDPMFESPVLASPQFVPLRGHLLTSTVTPEILDEARRVAKKRVIIKERPFAPVFQELPPTRMQAGKYSRVAYGIYE